MGQSILVLSTQTSGYLDLSVLHRFFFSLVDFSRKISDNYFVYMLSGSFLAWVLLLYSGAATVILG